MTTITSTLTARDLYDYSNIVGSWTIAISGTDVTASTSNFQINATCTAKYSANSSTWAGRGRAVATTYIGVGTTWKQVALWQYPSNSSSLTSWANNTVKTIPSIIGDKDSYGYWINDNYEYSIQLPITISTSDIFKSTNKASKTLPIYIGGAGAHDCQFSGSSGSTFSDGSFLQNTAQIGTVTLNAPPQATLGTPTYQTPYAGVGVYTVPLTTLSAQYGGDIVSVTLTVGVDSTTQTYSASEVTNQTISVIPSIAETYTPTIAVEDSRGQTTTITLPQITVNPCNVPSVSFDVYRTNNIGIKNDEGHYALIQSTISYTDEVVTLTEPSIQINGVDLSSLTGASVTWYKTWNNTNGVSNVISDWTTLVPQNHMVTIYGLIDWDYDTTGNFAEDTSYQITLVANDSINGHSTPITQTMSTAFYTIDFQAGGKEIAFGAPANDPNIETEHPNGLFKCAMDAWHNGNATFNGDATFNGNVTGIKGSLIGEIKAYAGLTIPSGWLECDGSAISRETYAELFNAIGTLWGDGDGSTTFNLPNLKGKVPVGHDASQTEFDTVGETGGEKAVTLQASQIPAHNHKIPADVFRYINKTSLNAKGTNGVKTFSEDNNLYTNNNTGGGGAHNNLQPYAVVKYIICAE